MSTLKSFYRISGDTEIVRLLASITMQLPGNHKNGKIRFYLFDNLKQTLEYDKFEYMTWLVVMSGFLNHYSCVLYVCCYRLTGNGQLISWASSMSRNEPIGASSNDFSSKEIVKCEV